VDAQKIKVWGTPFKLAQPPAKTAQNQLQTNGSQSKSGFVPKINKKMKKNGEIWRNGVSGKMGEMLEIREIGGRWWVEMAGGWLGSDRWQWCMVGLDFRECFEVENGEGEGEVYGS
jgi:hypothetical protein